MKFFIAFTILFALFMGCSESSNQGDKGLEQGDPELELLTHLTTNLIKPSLTEMVTEAKSLQSQVNQACESDQGVATEQLQATWEKMMGAFHYSEVFLYGPLLIDEVDQVDDENRIKEGIYSLQKPEDQAGLIEFAIEDASLDPENYVLEANPTYLGMDAIEYILFEILSGRPELKKTDLECGYLKLVNQDLLDKLSIVESQYSEKVDQPLQTAEGRTQVRKYLDGINKGVISFSDKVLKDRKMAVPLGKTIKDANGQDKVFDCEQGVDCHKKFMEHQYSGFTVGSLQSSLQALSDAFLGVENGVTKSYSYDQFIRRRMGKTQKATAISTVPKGVKSVLGQFKTGHDYVESVGAYDGSDNTQNTAFLAYSVLRTFTTWLKKDFIVEMNAELPGSVQGDTD